MSSRFMVAGLVAAFTLGACGQQESADTPTGSIAGGEMVAADPGGMGQLGNSFTGRVAETMDTAGYTYALLQTELGEVWVAGPETALSVGEVVTGTNGLAMGNFHSDTLNRDFDSIYFVSGFERAGSGRPGMAASISPEEHAAQAMEMPADHPPMEMPADHPATGMPIEADSPAVSVATREALANAPDEPMAIGDLFAARASLAGQAVTVEGKVVKFNESIMGRNWIHLQDGTGDAGAGTNDLLVTTDQVAKIGDRIKVAGIVALDRDFGAGYSYGLLLEESQIRSE